MFKKWHTTGRNKLICGLLALLLAVGIPVSAAKVTDFTDLNPGAWYYEEVRGAVDAGLFSGVSATRFDPDGAITRAQFVTALSRLCKADVTGYTTNPFEDVRPEHWFNPYVSWAYANGITGGTSPTTFTPDQPINRQEMCKMLGSALEGLLGKPLKTAGAVTFADQAKIADWAQEWVKKCNANGLLLGDDEGNFNPYNSAIRVQAAAVFNRCISNPELMPGGTKPAAVYSLNVSGFSLDFDAEQEYYLAKPANFSNCKILGYSGFKALTVSVETYATYYPYEDVAYRFGDALKLGHGRAKVTLSATLKDGTKREYLIALTDPDGADYAYARARVTGTVNMRAEPNDNAAVLTTFVNNARVYYLKTEGEWCMVEQLYTGKVGYVHKKYLRWGWKSVAMPESYKTAVDALKAAHPNWTFTFVDVERTLGEAVAEYGSDKAQYIDPLYYLNEDRIFAFLNIDVYDRETWNEAGIKAIWTKESAISKETAAQYFLDASDSLKMNPYYIACRAALESDYGTSKFAKGTVAGYEGYYNFFGINCNDSNPTLGAAYAKNRNWNTVYRSVVEGANWVKDQYLDQGAITPYFFRYAGFQNKVYMSDALAPQKEANILKRAFTDPNAKAHFVVPVYR